MTRCKDLIDLEEIILSVANEKENLCQNTSFSEISVENLLIYVQELTTTIQMLLPENFMLINFLNLLNSQNLQKIHEIKEENMNNFKISFAELPLNGDFNDRILKKSIIKPFYLKIRKIAEKNEKNNFLENFEKIKNEIFEMNEILDFLENPEKNSENEKNFEIKILNLQKKFFEIKKIFEKIEKYPKNLIFELTKNDDFMLLIETIRRFESYFNLKSSLNDFDAADFSSKEFEEEEIDHVRLSSFPGC